MCWHECIHEPKTNLCKSDIANTFSICLVPTDTFCIVDCFKMVFAAFLWLSIFSIFLKVNAETSAKTYAYHLWVFLQVFWCPNFAACGLSVPKKHKQGSLFYICFTSSSFPDIYFVKTLCLIPGSVQEVRSFTGSTAVEKWDLITVVGDAAFPASLFLSVSVLNHFC